MRKSTSDHMQNGATQKFDGSSKRIGHVLVSTKQHKRNRRSKGISTSEVERQKQNREEYEATLSAWQNSSATLFANYDKKLARSKQ